MKSPSDRLFLSEAEGLLNATKDQLSSSQAGLGTHAMVNFCSNTS
jgi:hypothetical protein